MNQWNDLWDAWDIRAARYCFWLCLKMRNLPPVMAILQATWGFKLAISLGKHDAIFTSRKVDMVLWFQSLLGIWYDPYIYIYMYIYIWYIYIRIYIYVYIYVYIYILWWISNYIHFYKWDCGAGLWATMWVSAICHSIRGSVWICLVSLDSYSAM